MIAHVHKALHLDSTQVWMFLKPCCSAAYCTMGRNIQKWKHSLPHAQRGNKKGTSVSLNGVPKTGNLGGSSLGSDLN